MKEKLKGKRYRWRPPSRDPTRDGCIKEFIKRKWSSGLFWAVGAAERKKLPTAIRERSLMTSLVFWLWKHKKNDLKSSILMAVWLFFSLQPRLPKTAQNWLVVLWILVSNDLWYYIWDLRSVRGCIHNLFYKWFSIQKTHSCMHLKRKGLIISTRTHTQEASNTIGWKYFLK